jgi:predicted nucleic acid-binding protein
MSADKLIFIDSNILIYAHDADAGERHEKAKELVAACWEGETNAAVSIQVLQEFHVNLVKKGVSVQESQRRVSRYLQWVVVENSRSLLQKAFEVQQRWQFSFWDSAVIAAALRIDAAELWSEDLQNKQKINKLLIRNPLIS